MGLALAFFVLALVCVEMAVAAIGYLKVQTSSGVLELPLVSVSDAQSAGHGVIKIQLTGGITAAAALVGIWDACATPLRVQTPYGTKAWKKVPEQWSWDYEPIASSQWHRPWHDVSTAADGGYILAGCSTDDHGLVLKTNTSGRFQWGREVSYGSADVCYSSIETTSDGGYVLIGDKYIPSGERHTMITKLNSAGSHQWTTIIESVSPRDVRQTSSGDYIVLTQQALFTSKIGGMLTKLNSAGAHQWSKAFTDPESYEINVSGLEYTSDGHYVVVGNKSHLVWGSSGGHWFQRPYDALTMAKFDSAGNPVWIKTMGGALSFTTDGIFEDSDGNYVMYGYRHGQGQTGEGVIFKISSSGDFLQGCGSYGTYGHNVYIADGIETADGYYVFVGTSGSGGPYVAIKTDKNLNSGCGDCWGKRLYTPSGFSWFPSRARAIAQGADGHYAAIDGEGLFEITPDNKHCMQQAQSQGCGNAGGGWYGFDYDERVAATPTVSYEAPSVVSLTASEADTCITCPY